MPNVRSNGDYKAKDVKEVLYRYINTVYNGLPDGTEPISRMLLSRLLKKCKEIIDGGTKKDILLHFKNHLTVLTEKGHHAEHIEYDAKKMKAIVKQKMKSDIIYAREPKDDSKKLTSEEKEQLEETMPLVEEEKTYLGGEVEFSLLFY